MFPAKSHSLNMNALHLTATILALLLSLLGSARAGSAFLEVMSTAPAVLDSPIRFLVTLRNADSYKGPFVFRWSKFTF